MDVVKTNLGRIGGSVEVATTPGKGTTYTLKIPLTLAIIPALLVTSGAQRYAIPQVNLIELVRATPEQIEQVHGAPVLRLRGRLLPLVYLATRARRRDRRDPHRITSSCCRPTTGGSGSWSTASPTRPRSSSSRVGTYLKGVDTFAGATILGDGSVGLILDVIGLARRAHVLTTAQERELATLVRRRRTRPRPTACPCWCSPTTRAGGWRSRWSSSPGSRSSRATSSRAPDRSPSCSTARRSCTWSTSPGSCSTVAAPRAPTVCPASARRCR